MAAPGRRRIKSLLGACGVALLVAGCASDRGADAPPALSPTAARELIAMLLPPNLPERTGWATDIYAAFAVLRIAPTPEHICAVVAVTEQESSFRADPAVPGLAAIAWREIDQQAERAGVPGFVVHAALRLSSPNGKSYSERIDNARTERQLSEIFEDFIGMVPLGKTFLENRNPVRTGGPMQVSIGFAEAHAGAKSYPYPVQGSIRREVFTQRGGMFFGIAHLLDYPASYDKSLYRFADFNAGRHASRNAAFQNAVSIASGVPLVLDGDLVAYGNAATREGSTELATRVLADRLDMSAAAIRRDLERGKDPDFERSELYRGVFALADKLERRPLPRAVMPRISLQGPKITRKLTTEWFAQRVDDRRKRCLLRNPQAAA